MQKLTEIRWHGRGGQGAKTASLLFGESALGEGKYVQAFPEYGPERMGAPVQSYNRVSDEPITLHCGVTEPDVVIVLDPTLLESVNVTQGLPADGVLIVNTPLSPDGLRGKLNLNGQKLYTVDASRISKETIGREIPNTPMLGALAKATGLLDFESMLENTRHRMEKKFRNRPEVIEGNVQAIKRAYEEAQG
ncbi:MAG: 2-oxoacid:acceptor oxidoreductase family protein [Armatimonadetes bacterium]|nr:2-oxoacid:acceptor oxidoreductase family protein [Armatimonadota bacterium]